jgi:autotransporter-associated beta strand protein
MSEEHNENELQSWIEPELEARVVAWVLGEASDFEAAELERIIAEKPELGIFKRRMEAVHGLVGAACRMELDPMRLETGRRERLLERLGRTESVAPVEVVAMPQPKGRRRISWVAVAAGIAVLAILMGLLFPALNSSKSAAMKAAIENNKLAELATAGHAGQDMPPTGSMASPLSIPMSVTSEAPAQTERLAALDSLKALANKQKDEYGVDDSGAGAAAKVSNGQIAETDGQTADLAQLRFERDQLEHDSVPSDAPGELHDQARAMFAAGGYAVAQKQAQAAEKQLSDTKSDEIHVQAGQTEILARSVDKIAKAADAGATAAPEAGAAVASLAQANTYTGAATVSRGSLAMAPVAATSAVLANSEPSLPAMNAAPEVAAAAAPVAAPAAGEEPAATAGPSQAQMAGRGGAVIGGNVADRQVQLGDIPVFGRVAGQTQDEISKAVAGSGPMMGQVQHAAREGASEKKDFGVGGGSAGGGMATGGLAFATYGQQMQGRLSQGAATQTFALNVPTQANADLPTRMLEPARMPIGILDSPALLPPRLPSASSAVPGADEVSASDQPYSTFSLHVSDVSFLLAKAALAAGQVPDSGSVRPEEFYNAFDYGDPAPATGEKIACRIEQAAHPLLQQRNLVRIAMKVAATGRGQGQPLRLTVLLDTSGSMEREDRAASVQKAMAVLTSLLGPNDAVTLIGFARQPRLLAEEVPGDQAGKLVEIVKHTPPDGGTNMEEAIKTASELALRHYDAGGQNRVVMLTDGAANLGDAHPEQLARLVERLRQQGVSFDACGVGADGLNDDILEALTRKGGGRYYFLNRPEDPDEGFARQLAGAFRPAAENVKMQVRFNPDRVGKYRLIGFENHRLAQEDFRNDKVTAAQLAAEEAAVALYQVQVLPEGDGEIGEVFVRFRDPSDGRVIEQSWTIPYDAQTPALDKASSSMQLAATASLLAEKLSGGPAGDTVDLDALEPIVGKLRGEYAQQARVRDLVAMFEEARRMTGRK